ELVGEVTQAAAFAQADQKLLAKLADVRGVRRDDPDGSTIEVNHAGAFRDAGMDLAVLPPVESGAKLAARPTPVRVALAAALDDWAAARRISRRDEAGARRLIQIARLADPDPWRDRLRAVLELALTQERLEGLRELARSAPLDEWPAASI